jgi:hypothetical protein
MAVGSAGNTLFFCWRPVEKHSCKALSLVWNKRCDSYKKVCPEGIDRNGKSTRMCGDPKAKQTLFSIKISNRMDRGITTCMKKTLISVIWYFHREIEQRAFYLMENEIISWVCRGVSPSGDLFRPSLASNEKNNFHIYMFNKAERMCFFSMRFKPYCLRFRRNYKPGRFQRPNKTTKNLQFSKKR